MSPSHPATEAWSEWWQRLDLLIRHLRRGRGAIVSSSSLRTEAKEAVQHYFRQVRPQLLHLGIGEAEIEQLDWITQYIVKLTSRGNRKSTYLRRLREITDLRGDVEGDIEIRSASAAQPVTRLTKPAEDAVAAVENSVGSLARSVYNRGSLSTHIATTRREVLTFKGYADAVLADLLQIHK